MKNATKHLIAALALMLIVANGFPVNAGIFGSDDDDDKELKAWRFDRKPTMSFARGTLSRDTYGKGWEMDGIAVQLSKRCKVVDSEGEAAELREGREAVIMGPRYGNTVVAWQIRILDHGFSQPLGGTDLAVRTCEADPTLAEGHGPN
jgi:hypothetical protein